MPQYPRTQSNVTAQVEGMIAGFTHHPEDFPHADISSLQAAYDEFKQAGGEFLSLSSQAAQAADRKLEKFQRLSAIMKRQIKMAQADCADDPIQLGYINWGPKANPSPLETPCPPGNLKVIAQEGNTVFLKWNKSSHRRGGPVRMYIIEKRFCKDSESWQLVATSYNPEITLKNQPMGLKMEYRVRASNAAGETCPTNTMGVVL